MHNWLNIVDKKEATMQIVHEEILISQGNFEMTAEYGQILNEIYTAISAVSWPAGSSHFTIHPKKKGNGVKPIKAGCVLALRDTFGWQLEAPVFVREVNRAGKVDALRHTPYGNFVVEWETGNISSSHRALNKISLGIIKKLLLGGVLILPTRKLYHYLTDRVGNYEELQPYFPVWKQIPVESGFMMVIAVEHDAIDDDVPLITKGTDGRALV
jgi:hypothetical protein